jgi:signal transduction histidine kinase
VAGEVFALNAPASARERIALRQHDSVGAQALWCDRRRLKQVLVNLVSNAAKYSRPGGSVEVGFEVADGTHVVWVRDSGWGIERGRMGELFQPFNRLGRERGSIPGTDIGLTQSRQIAEMMQGRLEVTSEPGVGSDFRLVLPRPAEPPGAT